MESGMQRYGLWLRFSGRDALQFRAIVLGKILPDCAEHSSARENAELCSELVTFLIFGRFQGT